MGRFTRLLVVVGLFAATTGTSLVEHGLASASADPPLPLLRVGSATVIEGDTGQAVVNVPVDLSTTSAATVTVNYAITSDTATAGQDFLAKSGKITIKPGLANKQISVRVFGDTTIEQEENVAVTLSDAVNATIAVADGGVTIQDDDSDSQTGLQVNIGDVTVVEGDSGTHTADFTVALSQPAPSTVKVYWSIDCSTAFPDVDYVSKQHGTITFAKGKQSKLIKFSVVADQTPEQAKSLLDGIKVTLGAATVNRVDGQGTIIDDDGAVTPPDPGNLQVGESARMSVAGDGSEAAYPAEGVCSGGSYGSSQSTVSSDGRYVAFRSDAQNLVPGDSNELWDVFVRDRVNGTTERVSVSSDGSQVPRPVSGSGAGADHPAISADGRYVTFYSFNPLPGFASTGVYLHDRVTGTTELISRDADGTPDHYVMDETAPVSADGRYVAWTSDGTTVVPYSDPDPAPLPNDNSWEHDVYVRDLVLGTNTLVSVSYNGSPTAGGAEAMSNDGRKILFFSSYDNIVPGDTNGCQDIFVRDLDAGTTQRVNLTNSGAQEAPWGGGGCSYPAAAALSGDGSTVTWSTYSWNEFGLTSSPQYWFNTAYHVYVRDLAAGTTQRVDDFPGEPDGWRGLTGAWKSSLSYDGRIVSYECNCDIDVLNEVYIYDRDTGATTLAGDLPDGTQADDSNFLNPSATSLSGDGHYLVFDSDATNLVPDDGDTNLNRDVFIQRIS